MGKRSLQSLSEERNRNLLQLANRDRCEDIASVHSLINAVVHQRGSKHRLLARDRHCFKPPSSLVPTLFSLNSPSKLPLLLSAVPLPSRGASLPAGGGI